MLIEWMATVDHGDSVWELYFSPDGGITWDTVATNIAKNRSSYNWRIPDTIVTTQGHIRVVQNNNMGQDYESTSMVFSINMATSLVENEIHSKKSIILESAYPNPFNGSTVISFKLAKLSDVEVTIFDISGRNIEKLLQKQLAAGKHQLRWFPNRLPSGVYFYNIKTAESLQTRRLVYIK